MENRARTQFLSAVVLVVVFAAGGLVGAAVVGPEREVAEAPVTLPASADTAEVAEPREERRQYMFERAGATEEQAEYIRAEIFPWYERAVDELWADSTVQALDDRRDSLRSEYRAANRDIEAYYEPRRDALLDSARARIRAVLDPRAQLAYDSLVASLVAERNRRSRDDGRHP